MPSARRHPPRKDRAGGRSIAAHRSGPRIGSRSPGPSRRRRQLRPIRQEVRHDSLLDAWPVSTRQHESAEVRSDFPSPATASSVVRRQSATHAVSLCQLLQTTRRRTRTVSVFGHSFGPLSNSLFELPRQRRLSLSTLPLRRRFHWPHHETPPFLGVASCPSVSVLPDPFGCAGFCGRAGIKAVPQNWRATLPVPRHPRPCGSSSGTPLSASCHHS